jgi:putative ubiquitin-RnfH superfamily antitoxin RatB of RatAB toxin-antitoxin module
VNAALTVTVAYAAAGIEAVVPVTLPAGATVADAVAASNLVARFDLPATIAFAIYGQRARPETPLVDGDRVELTRPLIADAKAIRRARAADRPLPTTRKIKRGPG